MSNSWLQDLIAENQSVETPQPWLYWSLMTCLSAVAANAYTLRTLKGNVIYHPNIYVILLGESGLGKGYPINLAKRIVQAVDCTRVIAGRSSIQAIIKELATTKSVQGKPIITDSRGFVVNGELSTAIIQDPDSLTILTDLFDRNYNNQWTNMLKGDGQEKLKEPYITCLFGSSPAHFYESIPKVNIEGGFIARNLISFEVSRSKDVDLLDHEDESIDEDRFTNYIVPKYIPHLAVIAKNKARIVPTEAARNLFNSWRKQWRIDQKLQDDPSGFNNRVPDHALKVAMLLSLSRYDSGNVIIEDDIKESINEVVKLIYSNQKAASGGNTTDVLQMQTRRVMDYLIAAPNNQLTRRELLVRGYGNYDTVILDRIIDNLLEMRWIKRQKIGIGSNMDWLVLLAGEPLMSYQKFQGQNGAGK